ncbi:MAG: hypothetical protein QM597_02705 [Aeromicrobium sp.]|uniref:hypothetical protein n=1 Tax=Aeromicrobium sp. TaxID=1871063 RepID=UPI0039E36121
MARPSSLAFRALDAQVIAGRADDIALVDDAGELSVAHLLHESAVIAGAWRLLGLAEGDGLRIEADGRYRVIAVLAALRRQLDCAAPGPASLTGRPPVAAIGGEEIPWDALVRLGRTDPLPAPLADAPHVTAWAREYGDVIEPLLAGTAIGL